MVSNIAVTSTITATARTDYQKLLFQKEVLLLLSELADQYGKLYPHFIVALRFLQQKKGIFNVMNLSKEKLGSTDTTTNTRIGGSLSQYALATARDAALRYGEQECQRIMKIISTMNKYFEVLVPRFDHNFGNASYKSCNTVGFTNSTTTTTATTPTTTIGHESNTDDNEDDEEVNWEEGDVNYNVPVNSFKGITTERQSFVSTAEDHEAAVERTLLAVMGGSSTRDYTININFDNSDGEDEGEAFALTLKENHQTPLTTTAAAPVEDGTMPLLGATATSNKYCTEDITTITTTTTKNTEQQKVRNKLIVLTGKLCQRHLPILDVWIEALHDFSPPNSSLSTVEEKQMIRTHINKLQELFKNVKSIATSTFKQSNKLESRWKHKKQNDAHNTAANIRGVKEPTEYNQDLQEGIIHVCNNAAPNKSTTVTVLPWKRDQNIDCKQNQAKKLKIVKSK